MPVTVAMGSAYYVFFMPMVIATRMRMPTVMGMPMTMCTGTYTIGKHAPRGPVLSPQTDNHHHHHQSVLMGCQISQNLILICKK